MLNWKIACERLELLFILVQEVERKFEPCSKILRASSTVLAYLKIIL
jgi:hypothetical protein